MVLYDVIPNSLIKSLIRIISNSYGLENDVDLTIRTMDMLMSCSTFSNFFISMSEYIDQGDERWKAIVQLVNYIETDHKL